MDLATAENVAKIGPWDELFDALEAARCELGVEGRLRMLGLVGRLAKVGADLSDSDVLQTHLAPIVVTESDKAAEIAAVIADWQGSSAARDWRERPAPHPSA